jgi:dihydroxyacid dehydratase/phosphogluconate dehydratase
MPGQGGVAASLIRIDMNAGRCDMIVEVSELARRKQNGTPETPAAASPWQRLYRETVSQLSNGAVIEAATEFRQIAKRAPRHNR